MMASSSQPDILQMGIARAQNGDKPGARTLFEQLAAARPDHETVWLWLASVADTRAASIAYLERALAIDPANRQARQWLEQLRPQPRKPSAAWRCPLCDQSFTAKPERCVRCGADLDVKTIDAFLGPIGDLKRERVEDTIRETLENREFAPEFRHETLALAYLNLRLYQKALSQLGALAALRPNDRDLALAVERLTEHLERQPHKPQPFQDLEQSDFETSDIDISTLAREASEKQARKPLVLIVDDSPTVRTVVSKTLQENGYRTSLASDGMEALARLRDAVPDLVLLDITMPHLDGFKICRVIKDSDLTTDVPVVFLSGKGGFLDRVRGRMVGAVDYLTKPVAEETLLQIVGRYSDSAVTKEA